MSFSVPMHDTNAALAACAASAEPLRSLCDCKSHVAIADESSSQQQDNSKNQAPKAEARKLALRALVRWGRARGVVMGGGRWGAGEMEGGGGGRSRDLRSLTRCAVSVPTHASAS
jgi:hypothetical protein